VTTIGLDGGYVHHCDAESAHSFEIIAGRVLAKDGSQRSMPFVRTVDVHFAYARTRVQQAGAALGGADDSLRVFTDGDGALRNLQLSVLPEATHVLDWYHLTRRLTVLASVINGKDAAEGLPARPRPAVRMDRLREVAPVAGPRGRGHHAAAIDAGHAETTFCATRGGAQAHDQADNAVRAVPAGQYRLDS